MSEFAKDRFCFAAKRKYRVGEGVLNAEQGSAPEFVTVVPVSLVSGEEEFVFEMVCFKPGFSPKDDVRVVDVCVVAEERAFVAKTLEVDHMEREGSVSHWVPAIWHGRHA